MMLIKRYVIWFKVLGLFFISLSVFTWGLVNQEVIGFDSRFYLFAQEMWRHGPTWFPTTYAKPYPDYPATSTFLIYIVASAFGYLNKFTAVLPSAIAASVVVIMTYLIGSLRHENWGKFAVLFLFLTLAFFKSARAISLDLYAAAITSVCFYIIYYSDVKNKPKISWWIYPLFFLGFLFRGPIGVVIPTGVICIYHLIDKHYKKMFITGAIAAIILFLSTLILLQVATHVGGAEFKTSVLRMEIVGRMGISSLPWYYYFTTSIGDYALSYPIAVLVILGVYWHRHTIADYHFLLKLIGWMLVILCGMSIPGDKKVRYILPIVPAIALLAAYPLTDRVKLQFFWLLCRGLSIIFLLLPATLILTVLFVRYYQFNHPFPIGLPTTFLIVALFILQVINLGIYFLFKSPEAKRMLVMLGAVLAFILMMIKVVEPIELYIERGKELVQRIETLRQVRGAKLVFYKENPDGLPIKYLINTNHGESPLFIKNAAEMNTFKQPAIFVTSKSYFNELLEQEHALRVIANGKLGHVDIVAFEKRP